MTELTQHRCPNCGGTLNLPDDRSMKCLYCGSTFESRLLEQRTATLEAFLDQTKIEYVNNQRRNLYDAVCAKYVSKTEVRQYATEIKKLLPDDFQANFYLNAISCDIKEMNRIIREIDTEENYELLVPILRFLITSLESEFLLELNLLVERAYKKRDLELYSRFATQISEEAEKVSAGVYETFMPRDVFIAYSSRDMDTVSRLCEELENEGFSCFVAARNLRHGVGSVENYDNALKEAMDYCTCFLFVSSVNSRRFDCDAVRKEIPYIRSVDTRNAPPEYRYNYKTMPAKYKKPRIEYRIGTMVRSATNAITNEFFDGYEWVYDTEGVIDRLVRILTATPEPELADESVSVGHTISPIPDPALIPAPVRTKACDHVAVVDPAVEASCTEAGRTEGAHCELCGEILRSSVPIPPHGHSFGLWTQIKNPTCTENGLQERTCHCGAKETKPLPSFGGHQPGEWEIVKEATETEAGLKVRKCTVCAEQVETAIVEKKKSSRSTVSVDKESSKNTKSKSKEKSSVSSDTSDRLYNVRLVSYGNRKLSCIKLVREVLGLGLSEAMELIESKDPILAKNVSLAEAERVKNTFGDFEVSIEEMVSNGSASQSREAKSRPQTSSEAVPEAMNQASQGLTHVTNSDGNSCTINGIGNCTDTDIVIPSAVGAYRVTAIGTRAFAYCAGIKTLSIPDTVTSISGYAFYGCPGLTSISIPDSVRNIGYGAFYGCGSLTSAVLPKSLVSLGERAFFGCEKLTSVVLPDSLTSIGAYAFSGCENLTSAVIPSSVTRIENLTFYRCARLATVVIPDSVTKIGESAFSGCKSLASIRYEGTKKQWKKIAIKKSSSITCVIECTDGTVKQKF